ncbi:lanthionine synthetase LanC family protein [Sphaerisporangium sp. NPDC051017]|uniref:lanthionine synthetase LanC family protein n=1 Tax=Sphaerisporangium sp. NPDC051017 TaxID=3154636 RepID=UPI00343ED98C
MREVIQHSGATARLVEVFEQQGDLFLAQEAIQGVTLRQWVPDAIEPDEGEGWGPPADTARRIARGLVDLVELVHAEGLVLRDFTPNNIMVTDDAGLRLIDLETLARPGDRVLRAYTPGYAAPEQVAMEPICAAPAQDADLYSLGATLYYLAGGADPLFAKDEPSTRPVQERAAALLRHLAVVNPVARWLAPVIVPLLHPDPARRPRLETVRALLDGREGADAGDGATPAARPGTADLDRMIADATGHLLATMDPGDSGRLWATAGFGADTDPLNVQHGAAGVLGVLTRAHDVRPDPALRDAMATAAAWLARHLPREPRALPGLHFGRSGTAWALLEAGQALGDDDIVGLAGDLARRVPLAWPNPDVCHGTSGAGLTQLRFWEATRDETFLDRARQAARAVTAAARRHDGRILWPVERDFASELAGLVHYGFAHGVAGVGAFLLATARATGDTGCLDLASQAAETLLSGDAARDALRAGGAQPVRRSRVARPARRTGRRAQIVRYRF